MKGATSSVDDSASTTIVVATTVDDAAAILVACGAKLDQVDSCSPSFEDRITETLGLLTDDVLFEDATLGIAEVEDVNRETDGADGIEKAGREMDDHDVREFLGDDDEDEDALSTAAPVPSE